MGPEQYSPENLYDADGMPRVSLAGRSPEEMPENTLPVGSDIAARMLAVPYAPIDRYYGNPGGQK